MLRTNHTNGPTVANKGAAYTWPLHGATNPGNGAATTPGSFALKADIGGPLMFSSPDTPGMPEPSNKTAWDFLPHAWQYEQGTEARKREGTAGWFIFEDARGEVHAVRPVGGFQPVTQLEHARLGIVTDQMRRVAEREGHLSPEQEIGRASCRERVYCEV